MSNPTNLNVSSNPNDPNERLHRLITKLQQEIYSVPPGVITSCSTLRDLIDEAALIATNYDSYVKEHSSPSLPIVQRMLDRGAEVDWAGLRAKGVTQFRLIPEMSAGGYEAVVLCHLARMAKVRHVG